MRARKTRGRNGTSIFLRWRSSISTVHLQATIDVPIKARWLRPCNSQLCWPSIARRSIEKEREGSESSTVYGLNSEEMVTLVVATTTDPASINPAAAFLDMPGWQPGPSFEVPNIDPNALSFSIGFSLGYGTAETVACRESGASRISTFGCSNTTRA